MQKEIYLDNSATTRQYDDVTELMADVAANKYGNPSSLHTKGIEAEKLVSSARKEIADSMGAEPREIYFTSGGTESNNLAIRGYLDANPRKGKHIITSKIEHPSVLEVYRHLEEHGYLVDYIGVDENGLMDLQELRNKISAETSLISFILVNNETGTIQQIGRIAAIRDELSPQAVIHADAVQAYGKLRIIPERSGIGLMSVSSHKIHGPKGVGALYSSRRIRIKPLFYGGGQEALLRSGTENVPGIAGFGLAAKLTFEKLEANYEKADLLKKHFIELLASSGLEHRVNSPEKGSPYVINISFANVRAEVLLHHLEQKGIFISTGSACSSHKNTRSHVLTSMGVPAALTDGAVRFSLSGFNTPQEIEQTVEALKEIIPVIDINRRHKIKKNV
ncbi:MAG TPA: cysteine desulfurase family protein [Clostridia bacterium]|nr:cysteine desulfurase family protein [Clostridia bacterium]